jgi:hypothetical protein
MRWEREPLVIVHRTWLGIAELLLSITRVRSTAAALVVLAALTGIDQASAARAGDSPALLNEVVRVYSVGVGEVRCPS